MRSKPVLHVALGAVLGAALVLGIMWLKRPAGPNANDSTVPAGQTDSTSENAGVRPVANPAGSGPGNPGNPLPPVEQGGGAPEPAAIAVGDPVPVAIPANAGAPANLSLAAASRTRYASKPGSLKVRIEGSSNIHDWRVEGRIIGGYIEAGQKFPTAPGQTVSKGKVDADVEAFIPVRSLISIDRDGKPYSTAMDDIMYKLFKVTEHPRIVFRLTELTLTEPAKSRQDPYSFDAVGELAVAGVTNTVSLPVYVFPAADGKIRITGQLGTKMTDFGIKPPELGLGTGIIKTDDAIKLIFDWTVARR